MIKLIQFSDTRAVWSNESIQVVENIVCRKVENIDILPANVMLEFNCKENELALVMNNPPELLNMCNKHHIKEIKLGILK